MASFNENGLQIDRLADLRLSMQTSAKAKFGEGVDLDERSPLGIMIGIVAERYALLYEILESVNQASYPETSFGTQLDDLAALNNLTRDPATYSEVVLQFTRSNDKETGTVEIPAGTTVQQNVNSSVYWVVTIPSSIPQGSDTGNILAQASVTGPNSALADTLTYMSSVPTNVASVTNPSDATLGSNVETDAEFKSRRRVSLAKPSTTTASGIRTALLNMPQVSTASVVVNDTDATDAEGRPPHCFESYVSLETGFSYGEVTTLEFNREFQAGDTITVVVNGQNLGDVSFTTDHGTTIALVATKLETSTAIRDSTVTSNLIITSDGVISDSYIISTVDVNTTSISSIFTVVSVDDGTLDAIGQVLWDSKAAGIRAFGDVKGVAVDDDGVSHDMFFSSIVNVPIYVKVNLTVGTLADYEASYTESIKNNLVAYSQEFILPNQDILTYKLETVVGATLVPDVLYMDVLTSTSASGPFDGNNIDITSEQAGSITYENIEVIVTE